MTRTARPASVPARGLLPRSLAGSLAVHSAVIGAGVLWGVLAAGAEERRVRAFSATFAAAVPTETEVREVLEPLVEPSLAEPVLAESELWAEAEVSPYPSMDPRDEPAGPIALRAVDWVGERPLSIAATGPVPRAAVSAPVEPEPGPAALATLAEPRAPLLVEASVRHTPAPSYPRLARRAGEEGSVLCRLHLDEEGSVLAVEVVESSGHARLDEAACATLATWTFEPRREDGRAVPSSYLHRVTFRLSSS